MILPHHAVRLAAHADHHIAQHAVVHIQAALKDNLPRIDLQRVPLLDMVVKQRGKQVVCRGNRMEIPGKMQV